MTPEEQKQYVLDFFNAWEKGTSADIRAAYDDFLSEDCVYENSGIAALNGKKEILNFVDEASKSIDVATMHVELIAIAQGKDCVMTERWDYHRNLAGELTLCPKICGVFVFTGDKISRWSDYFDPAEMLHGLET